MGREVRMVPPGWEHPKDAEGGFIPLHGGSWSAAAARWDEENAQWARGLCRAFGPYHPIAPGDRTMSYADWCGHARPEREEYMPDWPEAERTHFQMYEDCTEGTPISPVFASADSLSRWLEESGASAVGALEAGADAWKAVIRGEMPFNEFETVQRVRDAAAGG